MAKTGKEETTTPAKKPMEEMMSDANAIVNISQQERERDVEKNYEKFTQIVSREQFTQHSQTDTTVKTFTIVTQSNWTATWCIGVLVPATKFNFGSAGKERNMT
jgi:hypothetical protein